MTQPKTEASVLQPRRRQPSRGPLLLFLLLMAVALGGLYLLGRPQLDFTNQLAGPVRLTVDRAPPPVRVSLPPPGELGIVLSEHLELPPPGELGIEPR